MKTIEGSFVSGRGSVSTMGRCYHFITIIGLISTVILFSGCTITPVALSPRPDVLASTSAMTVSDDRKIEPGVRLSPKPENSELIGQVWVLSDHKKVSDLAAGVVALRFPDATMKLKQFDLGLEMGFWSNVAVSHIEVEVIPKGKSALTFFAEGRNRNAIASRRNMEIAVERALSDLGNKVKAYDSAQ